MTTKEIIESMKLPGEYPIWGLTIGASEQVAAGFEKAIEALKFSRRELERVSRKAHNSQCFSTVTANLTLNKVRTVLKDLGYGEELK